MHIRHSFTTRKQNYYLFHILSSLVVRFKTFYLQKKDRRIPIRLTWGDPCDVLEKQGLAKDLNVLNFPDIIKDLSRIGIYHDIMMYYQDFEFSRI